MGKTIFSPRFTKFNPYHDRSSGRFTSGAGGASGGPVVVTTIDAAIALLGKGKGVMFTTPDKAVTLIHKLAAIAQEARAKGEKAPVYDLCKVSVKGTNLFCAENVGIPRSNMPQLKGKPNPGTPADNLPKDAKGEVDLGPAFRDFMYAQGHKIEDIKVPASHLRASQTELNGVKVAGMVISLEHNLLPPAPIFVSNENYVIDGHHRWAANVGYGLGEKKDMDMPISRLDMPILDALKMAGDFAASMGIPQAGIGKAGLNAQEYMVAFMLLTMATKFNPYHDRLGRFASGTSLGVAPGQAELPGFGDIGLVNPGAYRQPQLFGKPKEGGYTELIAPESVAGDEIAFSKHPDADWVAQYERNARDADSMFAREHNMSTKEYQQEVQAHVDELMDGTECFIRVDADVLPHILADGRFKNQYETGSSNGAYAPESRKEEEFLLFGNDRDVMPDSKRPIYGYVANNSEGLLAYDGASQYGDIVIHLKESVKEKATLTMCDSLGISNGEAVPRPFHGADRSMFTYDTDVLNVSSIDEVSPYPEAQYHGGLTVKDIDKVIIPRYWSSYDTTEEDIEAALDKQGIAWKVQE